jgi:AcrR family transcriptional regulator
MTTYPVPGGRPYGRRADAERNREIVLDHAARLLSEDSAAGMAEIAAHSRIGRATLYRHFPTRERLIEAITARAIDDVEPAIAASRLDEGTAGEALQRLTAALLEVGDRYRFLLVQDTHQAPGEQRRAMEQRLRGPILALFERGLRTGEFARSLSPVWMTAAFGALCVTAMHEVAIGNIDQAEAGATVTATLLHGLQEHRAANQEV